MLSACPPSRAGFAACCNFVGCSFDFAFKFRCHFSTFLGKKSECWYDDEPGRVETAKRKKKSMQGAQRMHARKRHANASTKGGEDAEQQARWAEEEEADRTEWSRDKYWGKG
jgi:hypothetical protein